MGTEQTGLELNWGWIVIQCMAGVRALLLNSVIQTQFVTKGDAVVRVGVEAVSRLGTLCKCIRGQVVSELGT